MIIDTHIHIDDEAFDEDRDELIKSLYSNNISHIVNIGCDIPTTKASISLANKYDNIYAVIGIHPSSTDEITDKDIDFLKSQTSNLKVVAIGEIGLDYHWDTPDKDTQKHWFVKQLDLAKETKLPIVIHSRDAAKDTFDIMKAEQADEIGGVVHCYSYSVEMAREFLNLGFFFGIGGVLTFKNSKKLKEVVSYLPLENIVLETDAPYLAPTPFRGKRNSSLYIPYVIDTISEIKNISKEAIIKQTNINARKLYPKLK